MNLPSRAGISPIPVLLAALIAVLSAAPVSGRTWTVRVDGLGDAPTIQAGIDSAAAGDTVLVGPGTYYENITFRTKDLVVRSEMGPEATIIQGSPSAVTVTSVREPIFLSEEAGGEAFVLSPEALIGTVVVIEGRQTRATVLEGFTVTGGQHGVLVYYSSPALRNNVISGNSATESGGGVLCATTSTVAAAPLIVDNLISGNHAYLLGGGVLCSYVTAEITGNQILNNWTDRGDGGGIYFARGSSGSVIRDNWIVSNEAGDKGGGIYVHGDISSYYVVVEHNTLWKNTANGLGYTGVAGGGICLARSNALVARNTIVECGASGHLNSYGGGIGIYNVGNNTIEENIIAFSSSGGGILCVSGAAPSFATTSHGRTTVGTA